MLSYLYSSIKHFKNFQLLLEKLSSSERASVERENERENSYVRKTLTSERDTKEEVNEKIVPLGYIINLNRFGIHLQLPHFYIEENVHKASEMKETQNLPTRDLLHTHFMLTASRLSRRRSKFLVLNIGRRRSPIH